MSGATSVVINITLTGFTISTSPFTGFLSIDGNPNGVSFTSFGPTATGTLSPVSIPPGPHVFVLTISGDLLSPPPSLGQTVGNFSLTFNDTPQTQRTGISLIFNGVEAQGFVALTINCIHGSSLISTKLGPKRIDQLTTEDEVLSGDKYVKIKAVAQCWITDPGPSHDAIVFEKNSLGENEPTQRLIIDPGHPMCTQKDYLENGLEALRPEATYWEELKGETVYIKKWTDVFVQTEPSVRFDLILEEPYNTYVANGVVIKTAGYRSHSYKDLI